MENTANQINNQIVLWSKEKDKLVVSIDGYTCIGKTTILKELCNLNQDIIPVNRDDFLFSRAITKEKLEKTSDRSKVFELEVCDDEKLKKLVTAFKNNDSSYSVTVYDGISGEIEETKIYN